MEWGGQDNDQQVDFRKYLPRVRLIYDALIRRSEHGRNVLLNQPPGGRPHGRNIHVHVGCPVSCLTTNHWHGITIIQLPLLYDGQLLGRNVLLIDHWTSTAGEPLVDGQMALIFEQ